MLFLDCLYLQQKKKKTFLKKSKEYTHLRYIIECNFSCLDYKFVARESTIGKTLSKVKRFIQDVWTGNMKKFDEVLKPYAYRKDELSLERDCIMWGCTVVIPSK